MSLMPIVTPSAGVSTLSEQDTATSTAETITGPASIRSGDLIVILDKAGGGSTPTKVVPSGFTEIDEAFPGSNFRQVVSYKIADGSEASATITGMNGTGNSKSLYVFRGNAAISSVNVSTPNSEATAGNPASQSVLASGGTAPLIVFGCYGANGAVDPRTFTPAKDAELNPDTTLYLAYRIDNSTGQDTTVDMDDEGGFNLLQSFYIECS